MSPAATPEFARHVDAVRRRLAASPMRRSGPGSVSWKINREVVVVAGWGAAILLQFSHPLIAAGVAEHSSFRGGMISGFGRLFSTIRAMLSLTFGDERETIAAAAGINAIHDRVFGTLATGAGTFPSGTSYSAHQPELLTWVHATLLQTIPQTYELLVGPLTVDERERYCEEAAVMEPLLDIPQGTLPRATSELRAYMEQMLRGPRIVVTDTSRALANAVLYPQLSPLLWPAFRPVRLVTAGLLPPSIRDAYGFPWDHREARALERWAAAVRGVRRSLPPVAREWPMARRAERRTHREWPASSLQPPASSFRPSDF